MEHTEAVRTEEAGFACRCPSCGFTLEEPDPPREAISVPAHAVRRLTALRRRRTEALVVLTLDAANHLLGRHVVSVGSLNTTRTHPREVLLCAVQDQANSIIIAHNHPSGSLRPSEDDREFTRRIRESAELMGFALLDHLLVAHGQKGLVSWKESGWL